MKVPEEFVRTAIGAGWEGPNPPGDAALVEPVTRALEAVLPKVRERLTDGEAARAGVKALGWTGTEEEFEAVEAVLDGAFDHAFPDEPTSLGSPDVNAEHLSTEGEAGVSRVPSEEGEPDA